MLVHLEPRLPMYLVMDSLAIIRTKFIVSHKILGTYQAPRTSRSSLEENN